MDGNASPQDVVPRLTDAQRLEILIDGISDYAIYMIDQNGFVSSWNSGAQKIKGYSEIEILGQHYSRFFTPEDQAAGLPERALKQAAAVGRFESEGWRVRKDGTRFWASAVLDAIHDQAGRLVGFAKITRDITERKAAQEELFETERRFRLLVDAVLDYAICMLDPSGVVTNWNSGAQRLKGYTADEIVGQHFSRFYGKDDRFAGVPARALDEAARNGHHEAEGWRLRKDGSRFWASVTINAIHDSNGRLLGFANVTRDITERKVAHDALRESERQFRLLVKGVTDYALIMLDPNGLVISWNEGAKRIKGYSADEIIGQHFSRFYSERERRMGVPARALHTALTEGRFEAEAWRVRKDGTHFWANVIIDPIRDEEGQLIGFAKITRDITERREAQIAVQRAQVERDHAQKMDALGQLTGSVAHDFNNMLMIVSSQLRRLQKLLPDNPVAAQACEAIDLATKRGESLTRQLLRFAKRHPLNPVPLQVETQVEALRTMLESSIGSSVKFVLGISPDVWPILADANEFELALINLVLNARDAMPTGGTVTLTAENVTFERNKGPNGLEGEFVAVTVTDSGSGIAPDVMSRIFEPFFTTKKTGKGTGLGLPQVHGFAQQSGGTVTVTSRLGEGTSVTIFLPRAASVAEEDDRHHETVIFEHGKLLVVEDNPMMADATKALAEELGYTVVTAESAADALGLVEKGDIDAVLTDIVMAGEMDGAALAKRVREKHPSMPIVLVTGYADRPETASGEFPLLRKPYRLAELSRAIAKAGVEVQTLRNSNIVPLSRGRGRGPRKD